MIKVYGAPICKDCVVMKQVFDAQNIEYEYINIIQNTSNMREFLGIRDTAPLYKEVKESGGIGIPYFVKGDATSFLINDVLRWEGRTPIPEEELERMSEEALKLIEKKEAQ